MKAFFLDVDGCLNSYNSFQANHAARLADPDKGILKEDNYDRKVSLLPNYCWPLAHLCPTLIERLNKIVEATNCDIVLISSWRIIYKLEDFRGWMKQKGFRYSEKIIDKTTNSGDARGWQIQEWLYKYPEVTHYVILDDDSEDIVGSYTTVKHPENFVHCNFMEGLQDEQVAKAIEILNK